MLIAGIIVAIALLFASVAAWVRRRIGPAALVAFALVTAVALAAGVTQIEPFRSEFRGVYGLVRFAGAIATIAAAVVLNWRARPTLEDPDLLLDTVAGAATFVVTAVLGFTLPLMAMPRIS